MNDSRIAIIGAWAWVSQVGLLLMLESEGKNRDALRWFYIVETWPWRGHTVLGDSLQALSRGIYCVLR